MKLLELFDDDIFTLPAICTTDFRTFIRNELDRFKSLLKAVDDEHRGIVSSVANELDQLCDNIIEIAELVYLGKMINAYNLFSDTLQDFEDVLEFNKFPDTDDYFYRARADNHTITSINELFHVPFEGRYQLSSSRYSSPGLPCLYLSNSVYTCWAELNQPPFQQMVVSRFKSSDESKFLNLVPDFEWFRNSLRLIDEGHMRSDSMSFTVKSWLARTLKVYPLLLVCYIKTSNLLRTFKPEYIFPQLLMQWLINKPEYRGIRYMSTKCMQIGDHHNMFINYAIPVRSVDSIGYCKVLSRQYEISVPTSFERSRIVKDADKLHQIDPKNQSTSTIVSYCIGEMSYNYYHSAFKELELDIATMPYKSLISTLTEFEL